MDNPTFQMTEEDEEPHHDPQGKKKKKLKRGKGNILSRAIVGSRGFIFKLFNSHTLLFKKLFILGLFTAYNVYVALAIAHTVRNDLPVAWCDGLGLLIILTGIMYWSIFYYVILKGFFGSQINSCCLKPLSSALKSLSSNKWFSHVLALVCVGGLVTFIIIDTWNEQRRLVSAGGALALLLLTFILSKHPGEVKWRQVFGGLALQFLFALLVLRWEGGRVFLDCISTKITRFLSFADVGSAFIYDFVASGNLTVYGSSLPQELNLPYPFQLIVPTTFAFTSLSVIFFFSFFVQLLYHLGIMLWVVRKVGWFLQILVGTSAAESMNAAANIFLGQTEAPLLIKPFIEDLTKSELHAVMTGGFATIAGTVMAAYISFGVDPASLLSASVMAAPCALALSKLMYPEVEESITTHKHLKAVDTKTEGNALDAAAKGAVDGVQLVWCILANILAFVSFVAFLNTIISWFGSLVGLEYLSFEWFLGKLFIPIALCLGVEPSQSEDVAKLLGLKIVVNEFVAYRELQSMAARGILSTRSIRLAEYALCGFANFSSMGIQLGGLGALSPKRRPDLAKLVWRALFAGATASLINACVAGTLLSFEDPPESNFTTTTSSLIL